MSSRAGGFSHAALRLCARTKQSLAPFHRLLLEVGRSQQRNLDKTHRETNHTQKNIVHRSVVPLRCSDTLTLSLVASSAFNCISLTFDFGFLPLHNSPATCICKALINHQNADISLLKEPIISKNQPPARPLPPYTLAFASHHDTFPPRTRFYISSRA